MDYPQHKPKPQVGIHEDHQVRVMAYRRPSFGVAWGRTLDIERTAGLSLKAREMVQNKQTKQKKF